MPSPPSCPRKRASLAPGFMVLVVAFLAFASASFSDTLPPCRFNTDKVANAPRFDNFAVQAETISHPAPPVLNSSDAREFRTVLRSAATAGPNFAGHYTVAVWGCGSSCSEFAIIDANTGHVFFDKSLRVISTVFGDTGPGTNGVLPIYNALIFRADSRLLIVAGAPNEDESRDGVAYYEWSGERLKLLRFVPAAAACSAPLD